MFDQEKFAARHSSKREFGAFSERELAAIAKKLPSDIVSFLGKEGRASYSNDILWTCHPSELHASLTAWGLDGDKCFAFMRTALGGCLYYQRKKFYSLDSLTGTINCLNDDGYTLSVYLTMQFLLDTTWHLAPLEARPDLPALQQDQAYALSPALSEGGSVETSKLEVVDLRAQLVALAGSFGNKVTKL